MGYCTKLKGVGHITQHHPEGSWHLESRIRGGKCESLLAEVPKGRGEACHPEQQQGSLQTTFCHPRRTHTWSLPCSSVWSCCTCQSRLVGEWYRCRFWHPLRQRERETRVGVCAAGGRLIREEENRVGRAGVLLMSINEIKIRTARKRHFTSLRRQEQWVARGWRNTRQSVAKGVRG